MTDTPTNDVAETYVAEKIANVLELSGDFRLVDWNDLGEVRFGGQTFRMTVNDITDEE